MGAPAIRDSTSATGGPGPQHTGEPGQLYLCIRCILSLSRGMNVVKVRVPAFQARGFVKVARPEVVSDAG